MTTMDLEKIVENMSKRYIVTSAEIGAPPNHKQLDAYENYAKRNDAEIVVIPIIGQYKDEDMHDRFSQYKKINEMKLGKRIEVKDFGIRAQSINPLTGLRRFGSVNKSIIVGSPKQHLEFVANSNKNDPKAVMSTGACTLPNYKRQFRIGRIANEDHRQGAVLVDVEDDNSYHFRQVQNNSDGSFSDLGKRYDSNGKVRVDNADTMVLGDMHTFQRDPLAYLASLDMIDALKPKYVLLHDVFDGYSISHHDIGKLITRGRKALLGQTSLKNELYEVGEVLNEIHSHGRKGMQIYIVKSNHDEVLDKYLEDVRFVGDSENLELSVRLAHSMLEDKDPLKAGIEMTYGKLPKGIKFLSRDDEFKRYGWHLSSHGDKGPSGSRGSITSFEYSLGKSIVGHRHSPGIRKDVRVVGTLERPDVDYTAGSTGNWCATNAVIYKGGKSELINVIDGKWGNKE